MKKDKENDLEKYQNLVSQLPVLEDVIEKNYIKQAQTGNQFARDQVICANLRLVLRLAMPYQQEKIDLMDLIQEGNLSLFSAIQEFDCNQEHSFSSYAIWKIKGKFVEFFRKQNLITYPANIVDLERRIKRLFDTKRMSETEIQTSLNMTDSQVALWKRLKEPILPLEEIETVPEILFDPIEKTEQRIYIKQLQIQVKQALSTLSEADYRLVNLRFFNNQEVVSYREIAKREKRCPMGCQQRMQKIKTNLQNNPSLKQCYQDD